MSIGSFCTPKISVVTVNKNQREQMLKTVSSVLAQTYRNVEYVVVDGSDSDEMISEVIKVLESKPSALKEYRIVRDEGNGLYFAMNRGLEVITGDWVIFMNSGDSFYSSTIIEDVFFHNEYDCSVIYGDTEIVYDEKNRKIVRSASNNHKYRHRFVHQSSFIRSDVIKGIMYDTRFRIGADVDFFTKIFDMGHRFVKVEMVVSSFDANGVSSDISARKFVETLIIGSRYNKMFFVIHICHWLFNLIPRSIVKSLVPDKFRNKLRKLLSRNDM